MGKVMCSTEVRWNHNSKREGKPNQFNPFVLLRFINKCIKLVSLDHTVRLLTELVLHHQVHNFDHIT